MTNTRIPRIETQREVDSWRRDRSENPESTKLRGRVSSDVSRGDVVYVSGNTGVSIDLSLAKADALATSLCSVGMATSDVLSGKVGNFTTFGLVRKVDTSAYTECDILYLSETTAGKWTTTKPVTPNYIVKIGTVIKSDATDGIVLVDIDTININSCDIVRTELTPTTQTVVAGTLTSGTVSDVQTWSDGNEVNISEVAAAPGFDVRFTIPNVTEICEVLCAFYYAGSATHDCQLQIYDDTNSTWKELVSQYGIGLSHNLRYVYFPGTHSDFIDSSGNVLIRFYHPQSGNASHDLYIDFVGIIGRST